MKKVIVFDVENVLFNVKNVEKRLSDGEKKIEEMSEFGKREEKKKMDGYLRGSLKKCRMYEGVRENVERLMGLRKSLEGRLKVFVVSGFGRELVWSMLSENGIEVDGVYGNVGKIIEEWGFEREDVVYFSGSVKRWCEGDVMKVKNVMCGWGKGFEEGMKSIDGMWKEMGVKVRVVGEEKEEENSRNMEEKTGESFSEIDEIKLTKENIGDYRDIEVVGVSYRSCGGMGSDPGAVWIMDSEGRNLGFNMATDGIEMEDAESAIPSLKLQGPFAIWYYLGMGDCLTVDLYKWREYEKKNLPVIDDSCYAGWKSTVEDLFEKAAAGEVKDWD